MSIVLPYTSLHGPSYQRGYARSAEESRYPGLWKGLVGLWIPGLGPTGSTLRDVSGYGNHGTIELAPWRTGAAGHYLEGSADLDPIARRVVFTKNWRSLFGTQASIVMYLRMSGNNASPGNNIMQFEATSGEKLHYGQFASELLYITTFATSRIIDEVNNTAFDKTQWHSLAITTKPGAGNYRLYQDGKEMASGTGPASVKVTSGLVLMGQTHPATAGDMDLVYTSIYNRELTPNEVQDHNDPYALVRPRQHWYPAVTAAAPAAGNPWNYYHQQQTVCGA